MRVFPVKSIQCLQDGKASRFGTPGYALSLFFFIFDAKKAVDSLRQREVRGNVRRVFRKGRQLAFEPGSVCSPLC